MPRQTKERFFDVREVHINIELSNLFDSAHKITKKSYNIHMKIGVDIRTACGKKTGKGWYTFHVIKNLLALDKENEYILYTNNISGDAARMISHGSKATIKVIHKHPLLWHFAVIMDFVKSGAQGGAAGSDTGKTGALFFAPSSFIIPAFLPKKIRSVITVHDLIAFLFPGGHQPKATIIENLFLRMALRKASAVIVPSENTKKDLKRILRFGEEKIYVTPLGVDEGWETLDGVWKDNLPKKFVLTVGGLEPRKNIARLIDAIEIVRKKIPDLELAIVGGSGWKSEKLLEKIHASPFIKHITDCDSKKKLAALYRAAAVFVFPSLYEGFGLPPLEAMAAGCPVACSNSSSLPEVAGSAAIMFDPENTREIADTVEKILSDSTLRNNLIERGKARAHEFSWRKTAQKTLGVIRGIISS